MPEILLNKSDSIWTFQGKSIIWILKGITSRWRYGLLYSLGKWMTYNGRNWNSLKQLMVGWAYEIGVLLTPNSINKFDVSLNFFLLKQL